MCHETIDERILELVTAVSATMATSCSEVMQKDQQAVLELPLPTKFFFLFIPHLDDCKAWMGTGSRKLMLTAS
jgi:hypothetical protein